MYKFIRVVVRKDFNDYEIVVPSRPLDADFWQEIATIFTDKFLGFSPKQTPTCQSISDFLEYIVFHDYSYQIEIKYTEYSGVED